MRIYTALFTSLLLTSCAVGPDYSAPDISVPSVWHADEGKEALVKNQEIEKKWWQSFNDPTLNTLIKEAAQHNHDIRIALINIKQAKELRRESNAGFWPSLSTRTDAEKRGLSNQTSNNNNNSGAKERNNFSGSLDVGWELDVFGHIRRQVESSEAELQVAEEEKRGMLLSILAEVSRNYFEVRGLQKRIAIIDRNIELLREVEQLAETQRELGVVTELDVARARGEREATEASIPNLKAEMKAGVYRLSVLTGNSPEVYLRLLEKHKPLPMGPDVVPIGLRSDILRRRPDVRAAERKIASATAKVGVATADLFPKISLTGALGSSAQVFSDLFTSGAVNYTLGQTISWSLFEGGALRARIAQAEADAEKALISYEQTVLEALEESESALTRYGQEWATLKRLSAAAKTRKSAFDIARLRYEGGRGKLPRYSRCRAYAYRSRR
jgi:multidrug efflux system outer membrane protein